MPHEISEKSMALLERFVVLMCDRTSKITKINEAMKQLFAHKARTPQNIPPTHAALKQNIKNACYQANMWNLSLVHEPNVATRQSVDVQRDGPSKLAPKYQL